MMKYIIINSIPYKISRIDIVEEKVIGYSIYDIFLLMRINKSGDEKELNSDLIYDETKQFNNFPEEFVNLYKNLINHLYKIYRGTQQILNSLDLALDQFEPKSLRLQKYIDKYLFDNHLNENEIFSKKIFKFRYKIDDLIDSKWYTTYDDAFNSLIKLINALNGVGDPILNI